MGRARAGALAISHRSSPSAPPLAVLFVHVANFFSPLTIASSLFRSPPHVTTYLSLFTFIFVSSPPFISNDLAVFILFSFTLSFWKSFLFLLSCTESLFFPPSFTRVSFVSVFCPFPFHFPIGLFKKFSFWFEFFYFETQRWRFTGVLGGWKSEDVLRVSSIICSLLN